MPDVTIVLGNKRYSSWSLRGWLLLHQAGPPFDEIVIPLDMPQTKRDILSHNPAGRVPVVKIGDAVVWDSLAIAEFLHERYPESGIWPADATARALARSVSAEMHSGFEALRTYMPMDVCTHDPARGKRALDKAHVAADVDRVAAIWDDCRAQYGLGGDFLFGAWCAADAMFAPVVTRFTTYDVPLAEPAVAYRKAAMATPAMVAWITAAQAETWTIDQAEAG